MTKKYKVKYYYNGEESSRYSVKIKEGGNYHSKLVVRNKSGELYPEYYNQKVCTIKNTGNDVTIKTEHNEFMLTYYEVETLLTALLIEDIHEGKSTITIKKDMYK